MEKKIKFPIPEGYKRLKLTKEWREKAYSLVAYSFIKLKTEPLNLGTNVSFEAFYEFLSTVHQINDPEGEWSSILINEAGEVCSGQICYPFSVENLEKYEKATETLVKKWPNLECMLDICSQLDRKYLKIIEGRYGTDKKKWPKMFYYGFSAVRSDLLGKGLYLTLGEYKEKKVAKAGFKLGFAECTNIFSQGPAVKYFGWKVATAMNYDDYVPSSGGENPFKGVNEKIIEVLKKAGKYKESYKDGFKQIQIQEVLY